MMIVPKLDSAGELQLFPVDLSVTPNRVFPTRCMAFGRDSLTKYCLDSLTEYHGLAGYDRSSGLHCACCLPFYNVSLLLMQSSALVVLRISSIIFFL